MIFSCGHKSKLQLLDGSASSVARMIRYGNDSGNLCYACWKKKEGLNK